VIGRVFAAAMPQEISTSFNDRRKAMRLRLAS